MYILYITGGIIISKNKQKNIRVELYSTLWPKLLEYHKKNKKIYSKDMDITISDTLDVLLEEILEQKDNDKIYIEIDKDYQELIDKIDEIVSNGVLGYESREQIIIDSIRHRFEEILKYMKPQSEQTKTIGQDTIKINDNIMSEIENVISYKHELLDDCHTVNDFINSELKSSIECFKDILKLK